MVEMYADLVMQGLRALEPNKDGIPLVPSLYRARVKAEVERRLAAGEYRV